jgi:hypothetical protein
MKESLRRAVLFAVIVITGSLMILLDVPLIVMIPIILVVGFIILVLLGAITRADLRAGIESLKPKNLKNKLVFWKRDKSATPDKTGSKTSVQSVRKSDKKDIKPGGGKTSGFVSHVKSFVSSIGSLKQVISNRNKQKRKVDDINKLLDKTVNEKIPSTKSTAAGGAGGFADVSGGSSAQDDQDPFLSLNGDEFDESLLDGLADDEGDFGKAGGTGGAFPASDGLSTPSAGEESLSIPDLEDTSENEAGDDGNGLGDLSELDDAGSLGELDNLSLDDIDLEIEDEGTESTSPPAEAASPAAPTTPAPTAAAAGTPPPDMNKGWIESDTPQLEDQSSLQQDMASFASSSGGGSEEDLLSSIASDVKHVKKEKDLSLLRDLKDFKAPASDIEDELSGVYEKLNALKKTPTKDTRVINEMK